MRPTWIAWIAAVLLVPVAVHSSHFDFENEYSIVAANGDLLCGVLLSSAGGSGVNRLTAVEAISSRILPAVGRRHRKSAVRRGPPDCNEAARSGCCNDDAAVGC